jgi:SAM-dependent methyltransferase
LPPRAQLLRLIHGYALSQAIYVAARLGIADLLSVGAQSSAELAATLQVAPQTLHRMLRGLVLAGVLSEEADGRFALTPVGEYLGSHTDGSLRGLAIIHGETFYPAWGALLPSLHSGEIAFTRALGMDFFTYLMEHPRIDEIFNEFITQTATQIAGALLPIYDFSAVHKVVDLGGAFGTLLGPILQANPHLSGVLFDTAPVLAGTELFFDAAGLGDRTTSVAGDFFESVPAGGDLYLLSQILHDWDDEQCRRILTNCRQAIVPGGKLLIVERLLPERVTGPNIAVQFDLNMLVLNNGRERTEREYGAMLAETGFQLTRTVPLPPLPMSLLEATTAD